MADDLYAFRFEGVEYRIPKLMLGEARAVQKVTGRTILEFDEALKRGDADCLAALVWVARKRAEPTLAFEDVDGDVMSFEPLEDDEDEPRAEGNDQGQSGTPLTPAGP